MTKIMVGIKEIIMLITRYYNKNDKHMDLSIYYLSKNVSDILIFYELFKGFVIIPS